jgi:hypothetical protein
MLFVTWSNGFSKLTTTIVSTFSSYYTFLWPNFFPDSPLTPPLPSFDGRAVCYPDDRNLRDYMSWRQVDCKSLSTTSAFVNFCACQGISVLSFSRRTVMTNGHGESRLWSVKLSYAETNNWGRLYGPGLYYCISVHFIFLKQFSFP